jgi:hypothetical protein
MQQDKAEPRIHRAEDVRQGEIILKRPWQRILFVMGLVGGAIWVALMAVFFGVTP